jgi:nucleoid-associated protein EbfC
MPDFSKLLQQAQQMQSRLQQMQEELASRTVTATAGGGIVTVEADGKGQITSIRIDPSIVNAADVEMLEDLVLAGVREAQSQATELAQAEMKRMAGGMNLPFPGV